MTQVKSIDKVEVKKTYFVKSGALYSEIPYVNGVKHGIEKEYYESGALYSEIPYVNGVKHGIEKEYYESGALCWETPRVNGCVRGIVKSYYETGDLWWETPYVDGKIQGIVKSYDIDKLNIDRLTLYKRDREVLELCLESYSTASTKS